MIIIRIPKTTLTRLNKEIPKYQRILDKAKNRDVNESDTVMIITDILANVFGFDKFTEITSEQSIRGTFCDLAIKLDDKVKYLIEVKAVGIDLKDNHLRQAVNYGANLGIPWVILTNGLIWEIHKINFGKPISHELVCSFDFLTLNPKKLDNQERIYLLCKEGTVIAAIDTLYDHYKVVNKFIIGAIVLKPPVTNVIRRELRRMSSNLKVTNEEIQKILETEVIKREVIEGDSFNIANKKYRRSKRKSENKPTPEIIEQSTPSPSENPVSGENIT